MLSNCGTETSLDVEPLPVLDGLNWFFTQVHFPLGQVPVGYRAETYRCFRQVRECRTKKLHENECIMVVLGEHPVVMERGLFTVGDLSP